MGTEIDFGGDSVVVSVGTGSSLCSERENVHAKLK